MEAKEVIKGITEHERMCGKPLLIFANKQDCEGALSDEQIGLLLGLEGLPEDPGNITRVVCVLTPNMLIKKILRKCLCI